MKLTNKIMYKAILNKDTSFEGIFFTAVKTTGIFCRPSCTARKPKIENIEFLFTTKECILTGYRPCKVCKPMETLHHTPKPYQKIIQLLSENPSLKYTDYDLIQKGIEPNQIRRWFLKHHGITFQAYQRMFRINAAFHKMQKGESVIDAAFSSGYESLSGFGDSFKSVFGISPKNGKQINVINLQRIETPLGTMIACATSKGICLLEFSDRKMLETELKSIAKLFNASIIQGSNHHILSLEKELCEYFSGNRYTYTVPIHTNGTEFQERVWSLLKTIPYGRTVSYKDQADRIQIPASIRAVAKANGMNRISIIIPCHRVIGLNGELTGYGGGIWRKKYLLDMEKRFIR